jgi:hypothetical protein
MKYRNFLDMAKRNFAIHPAERAMFQDTLLPHCETRPGMSHRIRLFRAGPAEPERRVILARVLLYFQ